MIENFAIYLPTAKPNFKQAFSKIRSKRSGLFRLAGFTVSSRIGEIDLNPISGSDVPQHLEGFQGYVTQLPNPTSNIWKAVGRIVETKSVWGVILPKAISEDSEIFESFKTLAVQEGGFIFVNDSIWTETGFLVGPASIDESEPEREAMRCIRENNLIILNAKGFKPANNLPISDLGRLRPVEEIRDRLSVFLIIVTYILVDELNAPEESLRRVLEAEKLTGILTAEEREILSYPRPEAEKKFIGSIGWKTENMWPLAWVLGYNEIPTIDSGLLNAEQIRAIMDFVEQNTPTSSLAIRSVDSVIKLEDLFYCAHNAVRSAQQGASCVPENFDPMADGGTVHERRHALSWVLSPDVAWDDTDLST